MTKLNLATVNAKRKPEHLKLCRPEKHCINTQGKGKDSNSRFTGKGKKYENKKKVLKAFIAITLT